MKKRIAILGGGASGLFMYKRMVESEVKNIEIDIFERKDKIGGGMPYSDEGANDEHITNVSGNEIPQIVTHISEWVHTSPKELLSRFSIDPDKFSEYKVLPRLFFGHYLSSQFELLQVKAKQGGLVTRLHLNTNVTDVIDRPEHEEVWVKTEDENIAKFDYIIISTGHHWPKKHEGKVSGYFDAPYPPSKLVLKINHPVAIRGSSLTAIDAIRTLSRSNGKFEQHQNGSIKFILDDNSKDFRIMMHSRNGMLPAVRFHLESTHLLNKSLLTREQISDHISDNDGFLSLDFIFEKDFKDLLKDKDPDFYESIKTKNLEQFVESAMELRERLDPFTLFKAEYREAEKSIKRHKSIYWKEMLAVLSFAMNYPAKYLSAEDMQRLHHVLLPLISIVIAFVPQNSCKELIALHDAGILDITSVGSDSEIEIGTRGGITYHYVNNDEQKQSVYYRTFVDCIGQPHLSYKDFPFKSLLAKKTVTPARLKFKSAEEGQKLKADGHPEVHRDKNGDYYLSVSGITINDDFQILDEYGAYNSRIFIMAIPYIGGYNPDYSGLDFCEAASARIAKSIIEN